MFATYHQNELKSYAPALTTRRAKISMPSCAFKSDMAAKPAIVTDAQCIFDKEQSKLIFRQRCHVSAKRCH